MKSKKLKQFINEIKYENRNPSDSGVLKLLEDLSTNPEVVIHPKEEMYRCRIIRKSDNINEEKGYYGFNAKQSFVAPKEHTKDMRANYKYIPYLYCANHPYIAVLEVRPRFQSQVSVARLQVKEKITLLDFTIAKKCPKMSEVKQNLFKDLSELFSIPVAEEDDTLEYIPTQYIAEYAKSLGYDGIAFHSSLIEKTNKYYAEYYNAVIFNYQKCAPECSNVFEIRDNYLELVQKDSGERIDIKNYVEEMLDEVIGENLDFTPRIK